MVGSAVSLWLSPAAPELPVDGVPGLGVAHKVPLPTSEKLSTDPTRPSYRRVPTLVPFITQATPVPFPELDWASFVPF